MGMFDYISCKYPLPTAQDKTFQTKDLENCLDNYEIREDGALWIEKYDIVDLSDPTAKGIARIFGMGTRVNERWVRSYFSGEVDFYTNLDNDYKNWIEYRADFKDGVIQSLEIFKDDSQKEVQVVEISMELTKILKDEAWIEGERRQKPVPLSDPIVFKRSVKIWKNEKLDKKPPLADKNTEKV